MTSESIVQWLGGLLAFSVMGILLYGVWPGSRREAGRTVGLKGMTTGPYAMIRQPMYAGLMLAAIGSPFVYMTWTSLYFTCMFPLVLMRVSPCDKPRTFLVTLKSLTILTD